jgi:hypothetical protein
MDDADLTSSPILFLIVGGVLLLLFFYLFRSNMKSIDRATAPRRDLAYECVATPLAKADAALRGKFPALDPSAPPEGVELVRFGLFNWGELDLEAEQFTEPIAVRFAADSAVLSAELGETIKADIACHRSVTAPTGRENKRRRLHRARAISVQVEPAPQYSSACAGRRHNLEKSLFGPDHAEIGSGAFFGGLGTPLEVVNLSFERLVATRQQLILCALLGDGRAQVSRLRETVLCEPKLCLQGQCDQRKSHQQPATCSQVDPQFRPRLSKRSRFDRKCCSSCIAGVSAQFLFNAQQLVVLRHAVRS